MKKRAVVPWWQLELALDPAVADDAAALLVTAGATGVELVEPTASVSLTLVRATYAGGASETEVRAAAARGLGEIGQALPNDATLTRRADDDWAERWKEGLAPLKVGHRLWIVPTWEHSFRAPEGATVIRLDPGMAFGTGQHATTALCLSVIDEELGSSDAAQRTSVLDVGCGTGVLAIAAALLGADRVAAIDNDPVAVETTLENAALNHVSAEVEASGQTLALLNEPFALVVANILAPTLIDMASDLVRMTVPGGRLVLSGILHTQANEVTAAIVTAAEQAQRATWRLLETRRRDEWVALTYGA